MDDAAGAGKIAGTAADTFAFVHLSNAIGVEINCTEAAGIDTGAAAGTAIAAKLVALRTLICPAAAIAVDTGKL